MNIVALAFVFKRIVQPNLLTLMSLQNKSIGLSYICGACRFAWGDTWTSYSAVGCFRAWSCFGLICCITWHPSGLCMWPWFIKASTLTAWGSVWPYHSTALCPDWERPCHVRPRSHQTRCSFHCFFFAKILRCYFASNSGLGVKIFTVSLNTILILH